MSIRYLKQLPTNPADKSRFVSLAIDEVLNGEVSPLETFAVLKHLEDIIEAIKADNDVKTALFDELDKFPKGDTATSLGYAVTRAERKSYNYTECGDYYFDSLKDKVAESNAELKAREKFLQSLSQKMIDAEHGGFEVKPPIVSYTVYPVLKEVKESLKEVPNTLPF